MGIRYMDLHDLPEVIAFFPELFETNFPGFKADERFLARQRGRLREAYRDPGQVVLVNEDPYGISGFIWLAMEIGGGGNPQRMGEVVAIFVHTRVRGQGIGKALMAEGETVLRAYGCNTMQLMVTRSNDSAVGLYESLGFATTRYQMEKRLR